MTTEQLLLTENVLINAVKAFHDLDDKKKREQYVREYTLEFCEKNKIDPKEAIAVLNQYFERRRKDDTMYNFEHYKGKKTLERIILSEELSDEKVQLIENDLLNAIKAFHEISDPEERSKSIRDYTADFCANNGIKPEQALPIIKKFFKARAKGNHMFNYEHYQGRGTLDKLMLPEKDEKVQKSARNIEGVKTTLVNTINVYDLLKYNNLVVTLDTVKKLEEVYA